MAPARFPTRSQKRPRTVRPRIEVLEDRLVPAVRVWDGTTLLLTRVVPTANANWTNPQNWVGDVAPLAGDDIVFPFASPRKASVNNFAAGTAFNSIRFEGNGYSVTGNRINLGAGGITSLDVTGSNTLDVNLTLAGNSTVQVSSGFTFSGFSEGTLQLTGALSGSGSLTKTGGGNLLLSGTAANTLAGTVSVTAGTIRLNKTGGASAVSGPLTIGLAAAVDPTASVVLLGNNQIANGTAVTINARGTLDLGAFSDLGLGGFNDTIGPLTMNGGLVKTGAGLLTLGGDVTAGGGAVIEGNLSVGNTAGRLFTVNDGPAATDLLVTAVVSGAAGLTKEGAGRMELTAANTAYSGATTINAGTLRISNGQALGPATAPLGTTVNSGGTLEVLGNLNFSSSVPESLTLNGSGTGGGGALVLTGGSGVGARLDGAITLASATTIRADGPGNLKGVVSGSGALTKTGAASLALGGVNSGYGGAITVSQGTLAALDAQSLGTAAAGTTVQTGATLEAAFDGTSNEVLTLNGNGVVDQSGRTFGALFATANATLAGSITLASSTKLGSFADDINQTFGNLVLSGSIGGLGGLTILGGVTFTGATPNTYAGNTQVGEDGGGDALLILNKAPNTNAIPGSSLIIKRSVSIRSANQIPDTVPITGGSLTASAPETIGPLTLNPGNLGGDGLTLGADVLVSGPSSILGNVSVGNAVRTVTVNAGGTLRVDDQGTLSGGPSGGLIKAGPGIMNVEAGVAFGGTTTVNGGRLATFNGLPTPAVVNTGGTLSGQGSFSSISISGGTLNPGIESFGTTTGILESGGAVTFSAASTFHVDLRGTTPGVGLGTHDQLRITGNGSINLGNAKLDPAIVTGFQSVVGNRYTLVQNDTATPTVGQLTSAAGQLIGNSGEVLLNNQRFLLTYNDGDGNDVVLTHVNSGSALQNPAITSPIAAGGVAVLTGTLVEPDPEDSFFLDVNWGDGTPPETFVFPPGSPTAVRVTHTCAAAGTFLVQVSWQDDAGQGNNASLSVTVTSPPAPAPAPPTPAAPAAVAASLVTQKVGRSRKLFIRVFTADGRLKGLVVSPFQKPGFQFVAVTTLDTNGDGIADAVQLVGRKGKKLIRRLVSI